MVCRYSFKSLKKDDGFPAGAAQSWIEPVSDAHTGARRRGGARARALQVRRRARVLRRGKWGPVLPLSLGDEA